MTKILINVNDIKTYEYDKYLNNVREKITYNKKYIVEFL